MKVTVTHITDPGCPWAYSARPFHAALRWRFGEQLDWRLVMIGLTEQPDEYEQRGFTAQAMARSLSLFSDRWGMPFSYEPKDRIAATSRACRAVIIARDQDPQLGEAAFRALQFMQFTTRDRIDDDAALRTVLEAVDGLDAAAVVAAIDDQDVLERYDSDRALARSAAASPTEAQGKDAPGSNPAERRYTAPSLIFEGEGGHTLEAGGFQLTEAYDVILANLDSSLLRRPAPESVADALSAFPEGLTTAEVTEVVRQPLAPSDRGAVRTQLEQLAAAGDVIRTPLGDDALWRVAT
jgi:protein-disulfide isomerase-like protein with CxxC motif